MTHRLVINWSKKQSVPLACWLCALGLPFALPAATQSKKEPVVPKWGRFEQTFKSSLVYSNALQEANLTVIFTSPLGQTNETAGFWDGDHTWRVRFAPDQPGPWSFRTICSDTSNQGLHHQTGRFLCTAATGTTRFEQHGPIGLARDHRHLEHADGTPFFWLADSAWNGARVSEPKDWETYALTRAEQKFSVVQWVVAPGEDLKNESAFTGFPDRIAINPDFFRRLDAKVEALRTAGLLSAMVPFSEIKSQREVGLALPDDQAALIVRYVVARYGAEPVAWLLAFGDDHLPKAAGRWKHIGRSVFGGKGHAPVVLYPSPSPALLDEFRDQEWVDVFGFPTLTDVTDEALKQALTGPFESEWNKTPPRPIIPFTPYENEPGASSGRRFGAADVRRAAYWSLLLSPPAGLSYGAHGVANWDLSVATNAPKTLGSDWPLWRRALFMPGAKQMTSLATLFNSVAFWRLRPRSQFVPAQPGDTSPARYIAAAGTEAKDLGLVYVPEDRTLELALDALPPSPTVTWFNPRTGENSPAVAVVGGNSCQFPTPDAGDWLLLLKAGK